MGLPYIYQRTISTGSASGSVEQGVSLQNATMVRSFGGTNWTKLRIGIRYRFMATSSVVQSVFPTGTPRFYVGLCNGTTNVPGDQIINQCIGGIWSVASPVYVANDYVQINVAGFTMNVGSASVEPTSNIHTTTNQFLVSNLYVASDNTGSCDALMIDFEKSGSYYYKVTGFMRTSNTLQINDYYPLDNFVNDMQLTTPSRAAYGQGSTFGVALPLSFTTYPLNSVCIYWERTDPVCEIIDLYLYRFF